jgi:hypothetical protein
VSRAYVHGYLRRENERLQDQAGTLIDLLHSDTSYPSGSMVLEAGVRDLHTTARADGVFCYTFFKGVGVTRP